MKSYIAASAFVVDFWGDGASSHFTFGIVLSCNITKTEMSSGRDLLSNLGRRMEECMLLK